MACWETYHESSDWLSQQRERGSPQATPQARNTTPASVKLLENAVPCSGHLGRGLKAAEVAGVPATSGRQGRFFNCVLALIELWASLVTQDGTRLDAFANVHDTDETVVRARTTNS